MGENLCRVLVAGSFFDFFSFFVAFFAAMEFLLSLESPPRGSLSLHRKWVANVHNLPPQRLTPFPCSRFLDAAPAGSPPISPRSVDKVTMPLNYSTAAASPSGFPSDLPEVL